MEKLSSKGQRKAKDRNARGVTTSAKKDNMNEQGAKLEYTGSKALRKLITGNEQDVGVVRNCISCGKIYTIVQYEKLGRCDFCEMPMGKKVLSKVRATTSQQALEHKDRLLNFDRTSASRTKVLDDEADYYETVESVWATEAERDAALEAIEQEEAMLRKERSQIRISFDLAGRRIVSMDEQPAVAAKGKLEVLPTWQESPTLSDSGRNMHGRAGEVYKALQALMKK